MVEDIPIICKKLERCGLIGEILADAVLNLCADTFGAHAVEVFDSVFILSDLSAEDIDNSIECVIHLESGAFSAVYH